MRMAQFDGAGIGLQSLGDVAAAALQMRAIGATASVVTESLKRRDESLAGEVQSRAKESGISSNRCIPRGGPKISRRMIALRKPDVDASKIGAKSEQRFASYGERPKSEAGTV